jgi:hypothetical protein
MTVTVVSFLHKPPGSLVLSRNLPLLTDTICDAGTSGLSAAFTRDCESVDAVLVYCESMRYASVNSEYAGFGNGVVGTNSEF